jgi:CheY-like chemotaxis protein
VLLNLLSNAYKFTPERGTVSAQLDELERVENGYGCYEMRIQDSGIGMSIEFADKMFTAFERERTSTDSGVEGTGLGLAITKSIVDLMGGTIEVVTSPGAGTEIIIKIQFRLAEEKDFPETAQKEAAEREKEIDYSKKRLLLVEDNMINLEIAKMILSQQGFMLETAENGQVAVDMISASEPGYYHAVLMDIQMPVMDGYTATRAIRALENKALSSIPILAMTANAFKEDEEAAFAAGMNAHIAKPIDVKMVIREIRRIKEEKKRS